MSEQKAHQLFTTSLRRFLEDRVSSHLDRWETEGLPYRALFPTLGARGYLGINQPAHYGGLGLGSVYIHIWANELGRLSSGSPAMSLSVQTDIVMPLLAEGDSYVKETFLRGAISGTSIASFAVSEERGGSDLSNIQTTASPDGDVYVVNGQKAWITNGSVADFYVVACRTSDNGSLSDLSLLVVPRHAPGVTAKPVEAKMGNWASDHATVTFTNVRIPRNHLLGQEGDGYSALSNTLIRERRFLAVVACAQARRILESTIYWTQTHKISGAALITKDSARLSLTHLMMNIDMVTTFVEKWSCRDYGSLSLRTASVMKFQSTKVARQAAELALQLVGARAYMNAGGPARDLRDITAWSLAGGSDFALVNLVADSIDSLF